MSLERTEPWGRVVVHVTWRFAVVAVGLILVLTALLGRIDTPLFVAGALAGPVAIVEGCVRLGRGRTEQTQRLLLGASWVAAACWLVGCLLQATYAGELAAAGPDAAWSRTWEVATTSDGGTVLALCLVATSGAPVLVFARRAAERVREQVALAAVPAVLLGGGPVLLHGAILQRGAFGFTFGIAAGGAVLTFAGVTLGALLLHALDTLEARYLPRAESPDEGA